MKCSGASFICFFPPPFGSISCCCVSRASPPPPHLPLVPLTAWGFILRAFVSARPGAGDTGAWRGEGGLELAPCCLKMLSRANTLTTGGRWESGAAAMRPPDNCRLGWEGETNQAAPCREYSGGFSCTAPSVLPPASQSLNQTSVSPPHFDRTLAPVASMLIHFRGVKVPAHFLSSSRPSSVVSTGSLRQLLTAFIAAKMTDRLVTVKCN